MNYTSPETGILLFERIEEILQDPKLTEKERIPKYRQVLEELFKELTSDEKRYFANLSARSNFIFQEYQVPVPVRKLTDNLRKFSNTVVHELDFQPKAKDDVRSLYQLAKVVEFFSRSPVPDFISKSIQGYTEDPGDTFKLPRPKRETYAFEATVTDITIPPLDLAEKFCVLTCETEDFGTIQLKFWNNKKEDGFGSDLRSIADIAWPYCTIYVTEVLKDEKGGEGDFFATEKSLVVLEPDYLIDVRELADCVQREAQNHLVYLLNRLSKGEITDKMMTGNLVGQMLDDIARDSAYSYKPTFERFMRANSFGMLCMACQEGMYNRTIVQGVYLKAEEQEKSMRHILEDYKKGWNLHFEPTFISNQFGLNGRLDLLLENQKDPSNKEIIEQKSGNVPDGGYLYPNHKAQTQLYDLLIQSNFPGRHGYSNIAYTRAAPQEKPLRHVDSSHYLEHQALLMLRNRIVANDFKLAAGDFSPLESITPSEFGAMPRYLEGNVMAFAGLYGNLPALEKQYFHGFLQFLYRELQAAKVGTNDASSTNGFAGLWRNMRSDKMDNFSVLLGLSILEISDDFTVTLQIDPDLYQTPVSSFRDGDMLILYPITQPESEKLNPLGSPILKCTVKGKKGRTIEVSLVNKQVNKTFFKKHDKWALEADFRESALKTSVSQLVEFLHATQDKKDLLLGLRRPAFGPEEAVDLDGHDAKQQEIIRKALSAKDYFLIQGPPGTGKTSKVLTEIATQLQKKGETVMVLAFTNRAVDEVCQKFDGNHLDFIRLGQNGMPQSWGELSKQMKLNELYDKVKATSLFVSTQSTFVNSLDLLKFKSFDTLIVDEASQLLEPQLVGIIPHFKRFILIGDENQLPAVVQQGEGMSVCRAPELQALGLGNYRDALFSRLLWNAQAKGWDDCYDMLTYHYRMHRDIADFPNNHFYGRKLLEALEAQQSPIATDMLPKDSPFYELFGQSRVVFIPSRRDPKSKLNDDEAILAKELVKVVAEMYGPEFDIDRSVGVITPYRAQIANVLRDIPAGLQEVAVDTVERFQGSERDVIILSLAVKSTAQLANMQSMNKAGVDRKLNVALTRAKSHLIILGNEEVLEKVAIFKDLIHYIRQKGGYFHNPLAKAKIPDLF